MHIQDFIAHHLNDTSLVDLEYVERSTAFVCNLRTIIASTDVALHDMPSARYSITNLAGGIHTLEEQTQALRRRALAALRSHCLCVLALRPFVLVAHVDDVVVFLIGLVTQVAHPLRVECKQLLEAVRSGVRRVSPPK